METTVSYEDPHALTPHPRNPRRHDVPRLVRLILASGWHGVVTVDTTTGYTVVGHGRTKAAIEIIDGIAAGKREYVEWAELHPNDPVAQGMVAVERKELSEAELVEKLLGDNAGSDYAYYDDEVLASVLNEADTMGVLEGTGWDRADMDTVIADAAAGPNGASPDASPQLTDYEYRVIVRCRDERHQAELLDKFNADGLDVRALTS